MFEGIIKFFKKLGTKEQEEVKSKDAAKERLHLVLMQDRANVSADFLELMKQEIIEVIKKYIDVDETAIDVRLTNKTNDDGTTGAPALYANIPIVSLKDEVRKQNNKDKNIEQEEMMEDAQKIVEENNEQEEVKQEEVSEEKIEQTILSENKNAETTDNTIIIQTEEDTEIQEMVEEQPKIENNGEVIIDNSDPNKENVNVSN